MHAMIYGCLLAVFETMSSRIMLELTKAQSDSNNVTLMYNYTKEDS